MYQFGGFNNNNGQCLTSPTTTDLAIDQVYFKTFQCAESFTGPANIVPPPQYASGQNQWISTDFSLQVSISLTQWQEWNADKKTGLKSRVFDGILPSRGDDEEVDPYTAESPITPATSGRFSNKSSSPANTSLSMGLYALG
ncbi:MAG: hypothetical protein NVV73_08860 [Cellvibrionaceae bacterium]|nr:hypothetical protein [Cellvibrionaceae bacterium]